MYFRWLQIPGQSTLCKRWTRLQWTVSWSLFVSFIPVFCETIRYLASLTKVFAYLISAIMMFSSGYDAGMLLQVILLLFFLNCMNNFSPKEGLSWIISLCIGKEDSANTNAHISWLKQQSGVFFHHEINITFKLLWRESNQTNELKECLLSL